jgi:hypothetical protein
MLLSHFSLAVFALSSSTLARSFPSRHNTVVRRETTAPSHTSTIEKRLLNADIAASVLALVDADVELDLQRRAVSE